MNFPTSKVLPFPYHIQESDVSSSFYYLQWYHVSSTEFNVLYYNIEAPAKMANLAAYVFDSHLVSFKA